MSEETKAISVSRIATTCEIPNGTVLRWIVGLFPELAADAKLTSASNNYRGAISFEIEHTVQAPQPAGPILLAPLDGDDAVIGACTDDG
jgi:hypothetical protein